MSAHLETDLEVYTSALAEDAIAGVVAALAKKYNIEIGIRIPPKEDEPARQQEK